ncbi:MAG: hypothetical protein WBM46_01200 [Polyangiales bacterium]
MSAVVSASRLVTDRFHEWADEAVDEDLELGAYVDLAAGFVFDLRRSKIALIEWSSVGPKLPFS